MKRFTALVMTLIFMSGLFSLRVSAKEEDAKTTAEEICYSVRSWEEYQEAFKDFKDEKEDRIGSLLKSLPEKVGKINTFNSIGLFGIADTKEEVDKAEEMIDYAISLYNKEEILTLNLIREDGEFTHFSIKAEDVPLTHIGNVVFSYNIPYYKDADAYFREQGYFYRKKGIICYTCGVSYWNPDKTLEKKEIIPLEKIANLKDSQKIEIDTKFEGTTLILLCTTDTILGWAELENLYQYEDSKGNMEFYNPDFIKY